MGIPSEQLKAIYEEIQASFDHHQHIQVIPIVGSPPEQYRITYHLQGLCKNTDGTIQTCSHHTIAIALPFGFPHFPPNCTPESPIFHPDFDRAAICIGEFWEKNPSLTELILHIGRMVCGEIYSTDHAFNEEALIWYQENRQKFPLDTLSATTQISLPGSEPRTIPTPNPFELELVDDALFSNHEETVPNETAHIHQEASPSHKSDPSKKATDSLNDKATQKHQQAEALEYQGQAAKALELYKEIKKLVPDFPAIDADINRAQYSLEMLGNWDDNDTTPTETKANKKRTFPVTQTKKNLTSRLAILIAGSGIGMALIIVIITYFLLNSQYKQAQNEFTECKRLVEAANFKDAEKKCAEAMTSINDISIIRQEEKRQLSEAITQLHDSEEFQEGLRQSLSGQSEINKLPEWQQSMKIADQFLADSKWQNAMLSYTHTLRLTSNIPNIDKAILNQIRSNIAVAEFNISLQAGDQAFIASEWVSAKNHFNKAMLLAQKNPQIPPADSLRIKSLIGQVDFNLFMTSGEQAFAKGEWAKALSSFEQAQEIENKYPFAPPVTLNALHEITVKTKIYTTIELAKQAFADAQWDQAIVHYDTAIQLLDENRELLRGDNPQQSQQKIAKFMLHATIIRDAQQAATHLKNKAFAPAIDTLQATITTINNSPFHDEQEFKIILKGTKESIEQAQKDLTITENIAYLSENYKDLFIQNNPVLNAENLSTPKVSFLKKIGNKFFYKVQCFEQGHGQPVLLQSTYIFDSDSKIWRFSSNNSTFSEQEADAAGQQILSSAYKSQEKRIKDEQIEYLIKNFKTLCLADNPDLIRDHLSKPQASFIRKNGDKMLFQLKCLYQEADKTTPIQISYLYDTTTHKWEVSVKKQQE